MMNKIKRHSGLIKLILMIILSCMTQVVALMKTSIVAGKFGISGEMDSFNFANSIATFIFSFIIAGVSTIVIPCYAKKNNRENTDSFLTIIFLGITAIAGLILIFRFPIINIITGREYEFVKLSGNILVVLIGANLFSVVTSVTSAFFQYAEKYNTPKFITVITQLIVVLILFFLKHITIFQYTLIIAMGIVVNTVIDAIFAIRVGWKYKPTLLLNGATKELFRIFVPVLFSTGVYQISLMIDTSIASRLNAGDITILNYANQISAMVNTLLVSNLLIYFYPKLVKNIQKRGNQYYFWEKTYFFHAIVCLIIAGYSTVGREAISLLFEHGKFGSQAATAVFMLSLMYVSAQQLNVIRDLMYRFFYAFGDTKSATVNSVIATLVNIIVSILLVKTIGLYGIIIGTVVSSIVSLFLIMIKFGFKYGYQESIIQILLQYFKTLLITIGTVICVCGLKKIFVVSNNAVSLVIYGMCVVFVYMILTILFNRKIIKIAMQI